MICLTKELHEKFPLSPPLGFTSHFYSKLNDADDSFAFRLMDKNRGIKYQYLDLLKNILRFTANILKLIALCLFHKFYKKNNIPKLEHTVMLTYMGAKNRPIPVLGIPKDTSKISCITVGDNSNCNIFKGIIENYSFSDIWTFVRLLFGNASSVPSVPDFPLETMVQRSRELSHFYLFNFFLIGKFLSKKTKSLYFLYEDQPRDRILLLHLSGKVKSIGYIHTAGYHFRRMNFFNSKGDWLFPDQLIFKHEEKAAAFRQFKVKTDCPIVLNTKVKVPKIENKNYLGFSIFLPKNKSLAMELIEFFKYSKELSTIRFQFFPHPTNKKVLNELDKIKKLDKKMPIEDTLGVCSFNTNRGFEEIENGNPTIYVGSKLGSSYNPLPFSKVVFLASIEELPQYLSRFSVSFKA